MFAFAFLLFLKMYLPFIELVAHVFSKILWKGKVCCYFVFMYVW
jgi:hypothetical protein